MKLSYAVLSEAKLSNCFEVVGRPAPVAVLDWAWTYANRLRHNAKVVDPDGEGCAVTFDLGGGLARRWHVWIQGKPGEGATPRREHRLGHVRGCEVEHRCVR